MLGEIDVDVILVETVGAGAEHRGEAGAGRRFHREPEFLGDGGVGWMNGHAVLELERADVERVGVAMLGDLGAGDAVAAAALVGMKFSITERFEPRTVARAERSSRTQFTIASAVSQRSTAGGEISIAWRFLPMMRSSDTTSGAPQPCEPCMSPIDLITARSGARRSWHALGGVPTGAVGALYGPDGLTDGHGGTATCAATQLPQTIPIAMMASPSFTTSQSVKIAVISSRSRPGRCPDEAPAASTKRGRPAFGACQ